MATVATSFIVAGAAPAALAQTGAPGSGGAGGTGPGAPAQNVNQTVISLIDPTENASLTIHKRAKTDQNGKVAGNGLKIEGPDADQLGMPLPGAKFSVEGLQLSKGGKVLTTTDQDWWRGVEFIFKTNPDITTAPLPAQVGDYTVTAVSLVEKKTEQTGDAVFDGLPQGLYRVKELEAPAGYNAQQAKPFLVTLPMTNPQTRTSWNYDVHVYPKNQKVDDVTPSKTVADLNKQAGDVIDYEITAPAADYTDFKAFHIRDIYPNDRLNDAKVTEVKIADELLTDADYKVEVKHDAGTPPEKIGWVNIGLTTSGLQKLNAKKQAAAPGVKVNVTAKLQFTVSQLTGDADTPVEPAKNTVELRQTNNSEGIPPNNPTTPPPGVPPTTPPGELPPPGGGETPPGGPKSFWGNLKLEKKDAAKNPVVGAKFQVWKCNSADDLIEQLIATDDKGQQTGFEGTTDATGVVYIKGLHASNFANNAPIPLDQQKPYCLVEVQSPSGFQLLAKPVEFKIMANLADNNVPLTKLVAEIENTKDNGGFELPLTGGQGVAFLLGAGMLLIVMGGGAYYLLKRRED
ncbi:Fimbrial subunit type 1 precursor [Corynebacterium caspium DSM 44850]|nr:Fimbrial subunit type 1 precursor [Corynebacterium caspium DSM 44850]